MSGDCEIAQYYKWIFRVARKPHECCECTAPIDPGEKYLQVNACWENHPGTYRQHVLCMEACEFVRDAGLNDDECLYYGGLTEWYRDWVHEPWQADAENRSKLWRMMLRITRRERQARHLAQAAK